MSPPLSRPPTGIDPSLLSCWTETPTGSSPSICWRASSLTYEFGLCSQFLNPGTHGITQRKTGIKITTAMKRVKARLYKESLDIPRYKALSLSAPELFPNPKTVEIITVTIYCICWLTKSFLYMQSDWAALVTSFTVGSFARTVPDQSGQSSAIVDPTWSSPV